MRIRLLATLPLLAALTVTPRPSSAQISATIHLGRPIVVGNYEPTRYGDWHSNYRRWRPVTVYYYNGRYYPRAIRGARPVQIYRRQNEYFLPPRDAAWANRGDRRYNYHRRPNDEDYNRAGSPRRP
jgi:hypothetical protein